MSRTIWTLALLGGVACAQRGAPEPAPGAVPGPPEFVAAVALALKLEAAGQYDEALAAYQRAGALRLSGSERTLLEQRLLVLTRERLAADARKAVAAERELAASPPVPNTIAVLPWSYLGSDPELKPLERGMAYLLLSDLAKVSRFTLLERERVQALSDELALSAASRIEPGTAARSGRLLRAASVLQGAIRDGSAASLRLDANLVNTTTAAIQASGTAAERLGQLFVAEKAVVLTLLDHSGVVLTPAEQRAIAERPTADLQAFLAFSRGLEAEDRGNFAQAAELYQQAATRDPAFRAARDRAGYNLRIGAASRITPAELARSLKASSGGDRRGLPGLNSRSAQLGAALQGIAPTFGGGLGLRAKAETGMKGRLAEALQQDDATRLTALGKLRQTIPHP